MHTSVFAFSTSYYSGSWTLCFLKYCLFLAEPKHHLGFISGPGMNASVFPTTRNNPLGSGSNHNVLV